MVEYLGTSSVIWEFEKTGDGAPPLGGEHRGSAVAGLQRSPTSNMSTSCVSISRLAALHPNQPFKVISRGVTAFQELNGNRWGCRNFCSNRSRPVRFHSLSRPSPYSFFHSALLQAIYRSTPPSAAISETTTDRQVICCNRGVDRHHSAAPRSAPVAVDDGILIE